MEYYLNLVGEGWVGGTQLQCICYLVQYADLGTQGYFGI